MCGVEIFALRVTGATGGSERADESLRKIGKGRMQRGVCVCVSRYKDWGGKGRN